MAKLYHAEGYSVSFTTLKEELQNVVKEKQGDALLGLLKAAGCFSVWMTEKAIENMKSIQVNGDVNTVKPGFYIIVVEDFVTKLNKIELDAILYHELGHITNDHLGKLAAGKTDKVGNILNDVSMELEADAFALKYVEKHVLKTAIEKVIHGTVDVIERVAKLTNAPFHRDVCLHEMFTNPHIKTRLEALS